MHDSYNAKLASVADMFALTHAPTRIWQEGELGTLLQHQLDAPLALDLSGGRRMEALRIEALLQADSQPIKTFRDLFTHPHPPREILNLTKVFLKTLRSEMDGFFATEVATVLYYGVILVARQRLKLRLSSKSDQVLREGYRWALAQPWLDETLRPLFAQGVDGFPDGQPNN